MSKKFTSNISRTLISEFSSRGYELRPAHSYDLIAGFLGFKSHIALKTKYSDLINVIDDIQPSLNILTDVIDRMREIYWRDLITVDEIYSILKNAIYPNMHIIYPDDVRYLYSPYLEISINNHGELVATYKSDFYDLEYARSIGAETFVISEQSTRSQILDYLDKYSLEDEIDDPSIVMIDYQKFDTSILRDRNEIKKILN